MTTGTKTIEQNHSFGERRIYYNNFAEHLLNAYNPNMTYPELLYHWTDQDWFSLIDMIAVFGFNVFEYWLVPRLFCRDGLKSEFGQEFTRQVNVVSAYAHKRGVKVEFICSLATVGNDWHTLCPNVPAEWSECCSLWDQWTRRLVNTDIVGIFPGDPGACSRNGCTALTYIDRSADIAEIIKQNLPNAQIEIHTWGPPFFGWGNIKGPEGWNGEFIQDYQATAWTFDKKRADKSMHHLIRRLPDFPKDTAVSINLGFNPDGKPVGDQDARSWAKEIARTNRILTWDFSLTEGENAIFPHYRFQRLFQQRRLERESAPYSGGICFTMTPLLNQLSLYESAQSFLNPDAGWDAVARDFYRKVFGAGTESIVEDLPLFEVVKDWGNYVEIEISREEYHRRMCRLSERLKDLENNLQPTIPLHPLPEVYRQELQFFASLFAELSGLNPDYDILHKKYWQRVYGIYDQLPMHVDPRPVHATNHLINHFINWHGINSKNIKEPAKGQWVM